MYKTDLFAPLSATMYYERIPSAILKETRDSNPWFDDCSVKSAVDAIREDMLDETKLEKWLSAYPPKNMSGTVVGIVMAGNIPLVGFFDLLCVLITGAEARVKLSSKDNVLMNWCISNIQQTIPQVLVRELLPNDRPDAIVATGSNNANRYFRSAYKGIPALLRNNRTSIAVLTGNETDNELEALWEDIFTYYGLGCRNVSHLFLPRGFDPRSLKEFWQRCGKRVEHPQYRNNYLQNRAVMLMNDIPFLDGSYYTLSEGPAFSHPLSHLTYTCYSSSAEAERWIADNRERLQCIVSSAGIPGEIAFGRAQHPQLSDYADGEDLIDFLLSV